MSPLWQMVPPWTRQATLAATRRQLSTTASNHVAMSPLDPYIPLDYTSKLYALNKLRRTTTRPLTLTEKNLYSHLFPSPEAEWYLPSITRGKTILPLRPDRVACHDATATMALLQFISAELPKVTLPTSIHSDHLIVAEHGAEADLKRASEDHKEVYAFLSSASKKYGIGYWKAGAGIIHTTIFENYAFPGGLIIGTDSHTPNAGGMAMMGVGCGGADVVDAMAGMPWELLCPEIIGVRLTGKMEGWTSSKDIICHIAGLLTVAGGKGKVLEFFGPGVETLEATACATVCNMSAEIGSTSCIFPYTAAVGRYLDATKRGDIANYADTFREQLLTADSGSQAYYDEIIDIDLSTLEPHINGPFTPDLSHPLSTFKNTVEKSSWPRNISTSLIGSCTNSSFEDLLKVQSLITQARAAGLPKTKTPFLISPGSEQIRATAEAAGILSDLRQAGATVLSNSCGPCVGQWDRTDVGKKEENSVVSSFNRNFTGRHDGNPGTHSFVMSPELVTAFAFAGDLRFNPKEDGIVLDDGSEFHFDAPRAEELPLTFEAGEYCFQPPILEDTADLKVNIDPQSDRLQLLTPFEAWTPGKATNMQILVKVKGKCTTDHISPAGPWYKYRGHISNISNNLLLGATNAFLLPSSSQTNIGVTVDPTDALSKPIPQVARDLKERGIKWCIIGDATYGEGSSREHAALEPRFLGGVAVIAKSFARIHETNLKKQGMLPLTFDGPEDYDRIQDGDLISLLVDGAGEGDEWGRRLGLVKPGESVVMEVNTRDGEMWRAELSHSLHEGQIEWLREGSALNCMRKGRGG